MTTETFDFAEALSRLKQGKRLARISWKNAAFVFLVDGSEFEVNRAPLNKFYSEGTRVKYRPHVDLVATDGSVGTWGIGNVDILADDWYEVA